MAPAELLDFPAATFLRFYVNHGMLSLRGAPEWRTIVGGSHSYVRALLATLRARVHRGARVAAIVRDDASVTLALAAGERPRFDRVVIATHSDQALALLGDDATADERRLLGAIRYTPNDAWLHTDESFLPPPAARASWNYQIDDCRAPPRAVGVTYWMNLLQGLPGPEPLLVTLNPSRPIAAAKVVQRIAYAHPRYDFAALRAQRELPSLQGRRRTWFCGAYHGYGFHEDGYRSGLEAAAGLAAVAADGDVAA
jgi:predicted NAD/FAD-binding protein